LLAHLHTIKAISADRGVAIFQPQLSNAYDPFAIAHFGLSVLWRASVHQWGNPDVYPLRFGPYREELRRYLLGHGTFPKEAALNVFIRNISPVNSLTFHPFTTGKAPMLHMFVACGFMFTLTLGENVSEVRRGFCIIRGDRHPIVVTNEAEGLLVDFSKRRTTAG
jgi:hypothetical protein